MFHKLSSEFPTIVCLCGSTRFSEMYREANLRETLAGHIVLTIGCDFKSDDALGLTQEDKTRLDELHLRKIDLADEVLVLDVGNYIGDSTQKELIYAIRHHKHIRFLSEEMPASADASEAEAPPPQRLLEFEQISGFVGGVKYSVHADSRTLGVLQQWRNRRAQFIAAFNIAIYADELRVLAEELEHWDRMNSNE